MRYLLCSAFILLMAAGCAQGDVVVFKNGDRLTGEWSRVEGSSLFFKSDAVGNLQIPLSKIETFSTSGPTVTVLKGGAAERGIAYLLPTGNWMLALHTGARMIKPDAVAVILPEQAFIRMGGEQRPELWRNWQGKLTLGYSLERGDTQAGTLSTGVDALRTQPNLPGMQTRWRTHYDLDMLLATTRTTSTGVEISSNTFTSGVRQDYMFNSYDFAYVQTQFDHIQSQALNLRQSYGGGFGKDVHRTSKLVVSLLGGATYVNEDFRDAPRRQNLEGFTGERLRVQLSKRVRLINSVDLYPNITTPGNFRGDSSTTLSFSLNSRLSLNTSVVDFYLSEPPAGSRKNNLTATTGLGVNF